MTTVWKKNILLNLCYGSIAVYNLDYTDYAKSTNVIHSMSHRIDDVMKLCCELSTNHQIQTTVKGSGKGAAAAGGLAFAGGLVGGPLGIAVGGAVGGLLGCWLTSGQFKPLPQIIMELSPQQQQKLYGDLMAILGDIQWTDLVQLTGLVMGNAALKQQLTGALLGYITKELQAEVHYVD
ncbi:protein C19orf12 homolog isoform X1 [Antennarius striatus]|uniref:protein C19orf12 homolog isoform X1 n=2 Tax=Antennarius striatus TaxID=241820 RepID=UPI0035AE4400